MSVEVFVFQVEPPATVRRVPLQLRQVRQHLENLDLSCCQLEMEIQAQVVMWKCLVVLVTVQQVVQFQ